MKNTYVIDEHVINMVLTQIHDYEGIIVDGSFSLSCSIALFAVLSCYSSHV